MKKFYKGLTAAGLAAVMVLSMSPFAMAGEYVVQKGDYLSKIAPKYKTTWQVLADMNSLANPDLIFPNQVLQVPDLVKEEAPTETVNPTEVVAPAEVVVPAQPAEETEEVAAVEGAYLTSLAVEDISMTGNKIEPDFKSDVTEYTLNVGNDIYGVKVTPAADEQCVITVDGVEVASGEGTIVKLADTYEYYAVDYSVKAEIKVTNGDAETTYTVNILRENAADTYSLFEEKTYEDAETGVTLPYELYVPKNYDASKEYPVVFALHGAGQRTQSLDMVLKRYEMATIWAKDSEEGKNECIVVAPQLTEENGNGWTNFMITYDTGAEADAYELTDWGKAAYNLLQQVKGEYSVDENRIYATGLSMGGFGTYAVAIAHPDEFAAIVPVCGGGDPEEIAVLKGKTAIWNFHAKDDPAVSFDFYTKTVEALDAAGMEYETTVYEEGEVFYPNAHFAWTPAYANAEMRNWLFEQSK